MLEPRTFEGDAAEASAFIVPCWRAAYPHHPIALWDERYFEWQLLAGRPAARDLLVAAYDGTRLVGAHFAEAFPFELRGEPIVASQGSWFSVDPEYRRRGIGRLLVEEQRRRHRERGLAFLSGFGVRGTLGPAFWKAFGDTRPLGPIGFWYRVLDDRGLRESMAKPSDRILVRLIAGVTRPIGLPESEAPGVRDYASNDLPRCEELANALASGCDLAFRWTRERLATQLDHEGLPRTLVLERGGRVEGLVNWYPLGTEGRRRLRIAVLDLVAFGEASASERRGLLGSALRRMREDGLALAMTLRRPGRQPTRALWATGFVPIYAEYDALATTADPALRLEGLRRVHLHWR